MLAAAAARFTAAVSSAARFTQTGIQILAFEFMQTKREAMERSFHRLDGNLSIAERD
jgi:hypothetical protein